MGLLETALVSSEHAPEPRSSVQPGSPGSPLTFNRCLAVEVKLASWGVDH